MKKLVLLCLIILSLAPDLQSQIKTLKTADYHHRFPTKAGSKNIRPIQPYTSSRSIIPSNSRSTSVSLYVRITDKKELTTQELKSRFKLSQDFDLRNTSSSTDDLGIAHETFQELYRGIPVEGHLLFKHAGDEIILHGKSPKFDNLDMAVTLSVSEARSRAMQTLEVKSILEDYPVVLKIIAVPYTNEFRLAYEVKIFASHPLLMKKVFVDAKNGEILNTIELIPHADTPATATTLYSGTQNITTDENNGFFRLREASRKIETYDATNATLSGSGFEGSVDFRNETTNWESFPYLSSLTISETSPDWWFNAVVDVNADYYMLIRDGEQNLVYESDFVNNTNAPVTFNPDLLLSNGPYTLEIWDFDASGEDDFGGTYNISSDVGPQIFSDDNASGTYQIEERVNPALDVHWGMEVTHDFYLDVFGRSSYDGNGGIIKQYLNPSDLQAEFGNSPNNAFAIGQPLNIMVYGLGDGEFLGPVVALDVEGHEFSHLVINNNGNGGLVYQGESGALNESFADIFGVCVEFYSELNADWTVGEDVALTRPFLRSMSDPNGGNQPDTYQGQFWANPENLSFDNGGVHVNSGVQNYWFYLLSEGGSGTNDIGNTYAVNPIGIEKARTIAYRNLITYLGPDATYFDSYLGSLQAAEDLYGNPSAEYDAVQEAWYAVGIANAPDATCQGTTNLTASSGTVRDGSGSADYGNDLNCSWLIAPPGASQITIDFTQFDTEPEADTVFVYDGPTADFDLLLSWWGNSLPPQITTSGGAAFIRFATDSSTTATGWVANYSAAGIEPVCDGLTVLTEATGNIEDGSGTNTYGNNYECFWYIAPPCATSVTLSFNDFETEENFDGLVVLDGISSESNELAVFTGSEIPQDITSETGEMLLVFVSDHTVTRQGFSASYSSDGTGFCPGINEITDIDNGIISDGSGSENYCNNQECSWLISPPDAESIILYFNEFDLERPSEDGRTIYDAVEIYDGPDENAPLIGIFSGNKLPPPITTTTGGVFVKFYSDFTVNQGGWSFEYVTETVIFCLDMQTLTDPEGTLSDGSDGNEYGNNSMCSWLIQPDDVSEITLAFSQFDVEQDFDALVIYDGEDATAPLLETLSGSALPAEITSSTGSMFLEFLTDPTGRRSGWEATYTSKKILGLEDRFFKDAKLYPNPVSNILTIDNPKMEGFSFNIVDLLGREMVKGRKLIRGENEIDLAGFRSGIYLVNFTHKTGVFTHKIIVE